jgi:hypothetical protein
MPEHPANYPVDIYYGFPREDIAARIQIHSCGRTFSYTGLIEPERLREIRDLTLLEFGPRRSMGVEHSTNAVVISNDIIFSAYWLLLGAHEPYYPRDRRDNLDLSGSFFIRHSLQATPLVSIYAAFLRQAFQEWGREPLDFAAAKSFAFTHDVDYPQMIRSIECLRIAARRGWRALPSIAGVLRGTNHFWRFQDWVDWEKQLGTRPTFYFMARQGSVLQYALGTPDVFYDIRTREFRDLFQYLRGEGCEIGLHASYNAWRSAEILRGEKNALETVACIRVEGNRHHYWHLDPSAPHETLALHEEAELAYDSSLGLEYYPGFRRGICHPFRPYHPGLRREINVVQLPPAWMDDHFDRRMKKNGITDSTEFARLLVRKATDTNGIVLVDYHARGMNSDFFPRYGPWIKQFVATALDSSIVFRRAGDIASMFLQHIRLLEQDSLDLTTDRLDVSSAYTSFGDQ